MAIATNHLSAVHGVDLRVVLAEGRARSLQEGTEPRKRERTANIPGRAFKQWLS